MKLRQSITVLATSLAVLWGTSAMAADTHRTSLNEVMRDIEIEVAAISEHAAKLDQMAELPNLYSMTAYEFEWTGIEARFDDIGELVPKLQKAAADKGWQKEVANEVTSLIKAMEAQAEAGFKHLNDTESVERLFANEMYNLRVESITRYADHIDSLIDHAQMKHKPTS